MKLYITTTATYTKDYNVLLYRTGKTNGSFYPTIYYRGNVGFIVNLDFTNRVL